MFLLSEASARCREACTSKLGERGHLGVDALSTPIAHCVTPCCSFFVATWFLLTNACASCPPPPLPMIHIGCVFFFCFAFGLDWLCLLPCRHCGCRPAPHRGWIDGDGQRAPLGAAVPRDGLPPLAGGDAAGWPPVLLYFPAIWVFFGDVVGFTRTWSRELNAPSF